MRRQNVNIFQSEAAITQNIDAGHRKQVEPAAAVAHDDVVFYFQSGLSQKCSKSFRPGGNSEIADDNQRLVLTENKFGQVAKNSFLFAAGQSGKIDIDENGNTVGLF